MKKKYFIFIVLLLSIVTISFTHNSDLKYYYAYDEKIYLEELDNKLIVRYNHNVESDKEKISLHSEMKDYEFKWIDDSTCIITIADKENSELKNKIAEQTDIKSCNSIYTSSTGVEMGVTDEFLVKLKENVSQKELEKLNKKFGVTAIKITNLYILFKVPEKTDVLEVSNKYQESGLTRFSHPNFICDFKLHQIPNDPYFANQFYLNNTGQVFTDGHSGTVDADIDASEVWEITKGSNNIVVAVLDEGVTSNHPDLPDSRQVRLNGSNFCSGDPNDPSPFGHNNHGNACAGVIAATQNNNQGISGIAPACKIMPIRSTGASSQGVADAIEFSWENGADILSCSWGINSSNPNYIPVIRDAIIDATTQGRNNLGCVVVFSAGNNAEHHIFDDGIVEFPANVNVAGVLTVGASDRNDLQANYSPTGDPESVNNQLIDLVAPSHRAYSWQIPTETWEVWSIDIPGDAGYNSCHETDGGSLPPIGEILPDAGVDFLAYTGRFGGTSASCPQVAAVAALVLSINPNLTQQQVFNIITSSADKVGGYTYTNDRSNELGYGRLNACGAVLKALKTTLSISGPDEVCSEYSTFTLNNCPSGITVDWSISDNLEEISGNGTANFTVRAYGNGIGWVKAQISCADCTPTTVLKDNIDVGLKASFQGSSTVAYNGSGTWTADASCGFEPYVYQWWLREDNTGVASVIVSNSNPLVLFSFPRSLARSNDVETRQPITNTTYYLQLEVIDDNLNQYITPEQKIVAYGDVDLISRDLFLIKNTEKDSKISENLVLRISPNPANEYLNIQMDTDLSESKQASSEDNKVYVRLYNNNSMPVIDKVFYRDNFTINTSNLQQGIYQLQVIYKEKKQSIQILVQH